MMIQQQQPLYHAQQHGGQQPHLQQQPVESQQQNYQQQTLNRTQQQEGQQLPVIQNNLCQINSKISNDRNVSNKKM